MFGNMESATEQRALKITNSCIETDLAWRVLERLTQRHAPSQTIEYTRAPIIREILEMEGRLPYFAPNYQKTGNILLKLTSGDPKVWFFAHADEISYLFRERLGDGTVALTPFCAHRATVEHRGLALRFDANPEGRVVAEGSICVIDNESARGPVFLPSRGSIQPGDRVVYDHPLTRVEATVEGLLDNNVGVASCLLASLALRQLGQELAVGFVFSDEEEGPPTSNATFGRGARRLKNRISAPELCVVVDGHDAALGSSADSAALYAEKSSNCSGAVVPPHLYAAFQGLLSRSDLTESVVKENRGYVSRSDDVVCYEMTPNVLLLGYGITNSHFDSGASQASLSAVVNVAKIISLIAVSWN